MSQERLPRRRLANGSVTASIEEAGTAIVRTSVIYWRSLCGQKRFPTRSELTLRGMASFMPYVLIVRAIDCGADYEFVYVGDAQRQAFKSYFKGLRVSQIEVIAPKFGEVLRGVYDNMRSIGLPFIVRGRTDAGSLDSGLRYYESAFLPLGVNDAAVDHVLIVGVRIPEPFWDISMDEIQTLESKANLPAAAA